MEEFEWPNVEDITNNEKLITDDEIDELIETLLEIENES